MPRQWKNRRLGHARHFGVASIWFTLAGLANTCARSAGQTFAPLSDPRERGLFVGGPHTNLEPRYVGRRDPSVRKYFSANLPSRF
jgi:hypothetical protein